MLLLSTLWGPSSPVKTHAKLVGPARLVARFDAGLPPRVWQFDLEKHPHFTVEIRQEEGVWHFGVSSPPGVFRPVVAFRHQEAAWEAYLVVRAALFRQRRPSRPPIRLAWFWLILVAAIVGYLAFSPPRMPSLDQMAGADPASLAKIAATLPPGTPLPPEVARVLEQQGVSLPSAPKPIPAGVPVPADEALRRGGATQ